MQGLRTQTLGALLAVILVGSVSAGYFAGISNKTTVEIKRLIHP